MNKPKQPTKRVFRVLIVFLFVLVGVFSSAVYAQQPDTRNVIHSIVATSDNDITPQYNKDTTKPKFTIQQGAPAKFSYDTGAWYKKNGESWEAYTFDGFIEGTYQYCIQIRIDGDEGTANVLDENGIDITIDGNSWGRGSSVRLGGSASSGWAVSPEYVVTAPPDAELDFVFDPRWTINDVSAGVPITPFSLADAIIGGTKPYTFTKVGGEDWVQISPDGTVSGTPTKNYKHEDDLGRPYPAPLYTFKVTDSAPNPAEKILTIAIRFKEPAPIEKVVLQDIAATSNLQDIVAYGKNCEEAQFTVTTGKPAKFGWGRWYKKVDGEWVVNHDTTFQEGIYQYQVQVQISEEDGKKYLLDKDQTNITVDDTSWGKLAQVNSLDNFHFGTAVSPEFHVVKPVPPENKHITAMALTVDQYALGNNPYSIQVNVQTDGIRPQNAELLTFDAQKDEWVPAKGEIHAQMRYRLRFTFSAKEGYDFEGLTKENIVLGEIGAAVQYDADKKQALFDLPILQEPPAPTPEFTITVDPNGGNWDGDTAARTERIRKGEFFTLPAAPTKTGYTFVCWKGSAYQPGEQYQVEDDHVFTAEWKKVEKPNPPHPGTDTPQKPDDNTTPGTPDHGKNPNTPGNNTNPNTPGNNTTPNTPGNNANPGTSENRTNSNTPGTATESRARTAPKTGDPAGITLSVATLFTMMGSVLVLRKKRNHA